MFELHKKIDIIRKQSICERKEVSAVQIASFSQSLIKAKSPKSNQTLLMNRHIQIKMILPLLICQPLMNLQNSSVVYRSYFVN